MPDREMTGNLFLFARSEPPAAAAAPSAEARLVARIAAGDEEAFGEFYRKYAPMVHGIILARVPRDETPDLVQEVFLRAFKNLANLKEPGALGAWLAQIARHRAAEYYRTTRATEELPENMSRTESARAEANEVLAAIRTLPDAYRETLVLRLVEGLTGPEIAAQTGFTHESVRVNLHRGMKLLREKLGITEAAR